MAGFLKRKSESSQIGDSKRRASHQNIETEPITNTSQGATAEPQSHTDETQPGLDASLVASTAPSGRNARFAALKARNADSRKANLKATTSEKQRQSVNPVALTSLNKKKDVATHNLLKADTEGAGEDFERKRAWDWTIEESEKWDKGVAKKQRQQDQTGFRDYTDEAGRVYKRHIKHLQPNRDAYEQEKSAILEKAASSGGLEIVETADGELMAVDRDGKFYSTVDSTDFVNNQPSKEAIDRLVGEMQKQQDLRKRKRSNNSREADGDITYINDRNKQFNLKLARFYDKYTTATRESFERGTAI